MRAFLGAFLSALDQGQREAFLELLERLRREGVIRTQQEFDFELGKMLESVQLAGTATPSLEVPTKTVGIVTSEEINDTYRSIFIDLTGGFRQASRAAATLIRHDALQSDILTQGRDGIRKLLCDLRAYRFLKINPDVSDVKFVDFGPGQVGRNLVSGPLSAQVDIETCILRLRERTRQQVESRRGSMTPTVTVEILSSGTELSSQSFKPENAIDPRRDTFWVEIILTDRPIRTTYKSVEYDGTVVQATISLARTEFVNEIAIQPFAEFPLRIIDMETTEDGENWTTVPGFSTTDFTIDWLEQRIDRTEINGVRVTFHQPSFTEQVFLIRRDQVSHALLWDQIIQATFAQNVDEENLAGDLLQRSELDDDFKTYVNSLQAFDTELSKTVVPSSLSQVNSEILRQFKAITKVVASVDPETRALVLQTLTGDLEEEEEIEFIELRKLEYMVGAFNIRIADVGFEPFSVYHSPRFRAASDLIEVAIDADETHTAIPDPDSGAAGTIQISSVEYDVEISPDRRVPIVPTGTTRVIEFVPIDDRVRKGPLRFTPAASPNLVLRANGITVSSSEFSLSGKTVTITKGFFQRNHRYVMEYNIAANQDVMDIDTLFNSKPIKAPEVFAETEPDGSVQLRHVPFVAMEVINGTEGVSPDWIKPDLFDAVFVYRADRAAVTIDGISYGAAAGVLSVGIAKTTTVITVSGGASFPSIGKLEIVGVNGDTEVVTYTGFSSGTFTGVVRGASGSANFAFITGATVRLSSSLRYEPTSVTVDGIRARNLTDYLTGVNPAFVAPDPRRREFSYIQIGRSLFFSDVIKNKRIEVSYNTLAEYVQLQATLRCNTPVIHPVTPVINEFRLKLKQGSLS